MTGQGCGRVSPSSMRTSGALSCTTAKVGEQSRVQPMRSSQCSSGGALWRWLGSVHRSSIASAGRRGAEVGHRGHRLCPEPDPPRTPKQYPRWATSSYECHAGVVGSSAAQRSESRPARRWGTAMASEEKVGVVEEDIEEPVKEQGKPLCLEPCPKCRAATYSGGTI